MTEKLPDLNAMRQSIAEKTETPKSFEQRITELRAKIEEAENSSGQSNFLETFLALSPEEQAQEVNRVVRNRDLSPDSYTLEDRKNELQETDSKPPVLRTVRLQVWKDELQRLLENPDSTA
jgi:predicted  nucleic acid-binding Zn-ribbon protein